MIRRTFFGCLALLLTVFEALAQNWPSLDLIEMIPGQFEAVRINVRQDPVYKTPKHYLGYPLANIIKHLRIPEPYQADDVVIVFTAKDGYRVTMAFNDAVEGQGYLVFRDTAAPENRDWLEFKFGKQEMTPAPFYLVWPKEGLDKWRYPWPFQLTTIGLELASSYFGAAAPRNSDPTIREGFHLFGTYCMRCHSVNLAGGQVGPELNVPKNITEYFIERELPGFILNASDYRAGTKMPAFDDILDAEQIRSIMRYLEHMKSEKINAEE